MISALFYLQFQSFKNRVMTRVRRLRRPKYLFGALFGAAYMGLVVLRPLLAAGRNGPSMLMPREFAGTWEFLAAAALLVGMLLAWAIPRERAGLVFTEAEIAFLFPAPVRRSALVQFKLLKAQLGILFTVGFLTLLSLRSSHLATAGQRAVGLWLVLSIINLHLLGASFARSMLLERGVSNGVRRAVTLMIALAAIGGAATWVKLGTPALQSGDLQSGDALAHYFHTVTDSPPARVLLAPFRAVVAPVFANGGAAFVRALWPALALLALHYLWVSRADVAFEEASLEVSRQYAARVANARGNRWGAGRPRRKARPPFPLSPTGAPAVALLWKNLLSAGQLFSLRVWIPVMFWGMCMGYVFNGASERSPWPHVVGTAAIVLAAFSVLIGPQIVRQDFRQDLAAVDLLKTYPLSGRQTAFGQLLAPVVILTAFQWLLLGVGALLFDAAQFARTGIGSGQVELAGCLAVLAPPMNLITLLIPNAAALLYPGWFLSAPSAARGIETMGQRLMFMVAMLAILLLTVAPAAGAFAFVYLVTPVLLPDATALPAAALATAGVLAAEGAVGIVLLGRLFERFDPSAETAA